MKSKFKRISKSTLSVILALMMVLSTMFIGSFTTTAATVDKDPVGASTMRIYFTPETVTNWEQGTFTYSDVNNFKVNYQYGSNDSEWSNTPMYKFEKTVGGKDVYYADLNLPYNGFYVIEFEAYKNSIKYGYDSAYRSSTWATDSSYSGKLWNGTSWDTPAWDSTQATYTLYGNFDGSYKDYTITDGVVNVSLSANKTYNYQIKKTVGSTVSYYGNNGTMTSVNCSGWNFSLDTNACGITTTNAGNYIFNIDTTVNSDGKPQVSVTYPSEKPSVNFGSNNGGTISASANDTNINSGTTFDEATDVTFTATPSENYVIEGWYSDSNFTNKIDSAGTLETYNVTVSTAVTVFVKFKSTLTPTYQVAIKSGSPVDMHETSVAGVYISDSIISNGTDFKIKNSDGKYAKRGDGDANGSTYYINSTNDRNAKVSDDWTDTYGTYSCNDWKINCFDAYVVYDSNAKIVYLTLDPNNKQSFTIYAKSGTVRNDRVYNKVTGSLGYGVTTVSGAGDIDDTTSYYDSTTHKYYNVAEDTAITITTTMTENANNLGYYVWAFCVNGKYVEAIKDVDSDGNVIYRSSAYRLNSEDAVNNSFEITPIYLNRIVEADGDYIHLYVDASSVKDTWGNTIAVYPYAQSGETVPLNKKPFGDYPGQPMVLNGRFYEILVPKHEYVEENGKLTKTENYMFGLTVCSYSLDTIHSEITQNATNYQTYDYSDFIQLTKDADVTAALFSIKRYVDKDHYSIIYSGAGYTGIKDNIGTDWNNLETNPFEDFTDFYGRNTDIFGNILEEDQIANTDKSVHIISLGNINISSGDDDYTTIGQWATKWFVYDNEGNLISEGTPSQYIDENSPVRQELLNNCGDKCKNVLTYISYDKEKTDDGVRSDGRWYYSKVGDVEFTSDVAIEYNSGNGEWIEDENSGVENEDGFVSTVTNGSVARLDGVRKATYKSVDGTATISVDVKDGWTFAGWYIKSKNADDSYSYYEISKTNTTVNDFQMNNSYHIVARLEKIPEGSLVLRHAQYSGANPPAHSGGSIVGQYFIKAVVKDSDNNIVKTYDFTEDPISIDYLRSDYTIDVTLKTVCYEPNTFYSWYQMAPDGNYFEIGPEDYDPRGQEGELTFEKTLYCSQLFNGQDLEVNVIRFYSDLVKVSGTCDITYKYYDRFAENGVGKMVSYVVNDVELSPVEIKAGYIPSNETIAKYAPYIDTIYLDTKWDLTDSGKVTKTKSYAEVTASQSDKKCTVYYPTGEYFDGPCDSFVVPYNAFLGNGDVNNPDDFNFLLTAPDKNAEGKEFSYWNIYKADVNGSKTNTLIAKCYDRTFNFRIYDDYYLEVVYGAGRDNVSAEINDPVMNREIFGDASSATDRLYVDLLVSYYSSLVPVFKDNNPDNTGYTVECGVIVDRNNTNTLSDADMNSIKEAAQNGTELDPTILQGYFNDFGLDVDKALDVAKDTSKGDKSKTTYTDTSGYVHRLSKYVLNNEDLTNKNRIDKVLVYTNNEANQKYIFAAYAYVIVRNADGTIAQWDISNANEVQFYNLCYTANIPAQTSAN